MNERPFDDIESMIRQAADQFEPAYDPNAWELMNARLNEEDQKHRNWLPWLFLFATLIISVGGYLYFRNQHPADRIASESNKKIQTAEALQNPAPSEEKAHSATSISSASQQHINNAFTGPSVKNAPTARSAKVSALSDSRLRNKTFYKQSGDNVPYSKNQPVSDPADLLKSEWNQHPKITRKRTRSASQKTSILPAITGEPGTAQPSTPSLATDAAERATEPAALLQPAVKSAPLHPEVAAVDSGQKKEPKLTPTAAKKATGNLQKSRWSLSIYSGADASGTGLIPAGDYSFRFGIMAAYSLTPHLSIQAGVFQNTKRYQCGPKAYQLPSYGYWNYMQIYQIHAACKMTEIPVQLKFSIPGKNQQEWYGAAGISSYLISRETYDYHYFRYNNPGVKTSNYTGNKHLFSQASFTLGYSFPVSKNISILGELYQQIPLYGIGAGKVHLYAGGFQAGVRYHPSRKK